MAMKTILFLNILLYVIIVAESKPTDLVQINHMHRVVDEFISSSTGISLYFCNIKDAKTAIKYNLNRPYAVNSHLLKFINSTQDITVSFQQPQVLQVFVDLTCKNGFSLLQQSSQLFNSSYRWLLWTQDYNGTLNQLHLSRVLMDSKVNVALFSGNSVTVYDLYKMHRSLPFTVTTVREWSSDGASYSLDVPGPRNNFMGTTINCTVMLRSLDYNQRNFMEIFLNAALFHGLDSRPRADIHLIMFIAEHYNFTLNFIYTDTWGIPVKTGYYSGMVGMLYRNEAEISGGFASMSTERFNVIDYFVPLTTAKTSFFFLQPQSIGTYKALIVPLEPQTWGLLFLTVTVLIILMNIKKISVSTWSDNVLLVLSTLSNQGAFDVMRTLSGKLLFLTVLLFSFLVLQYYSIALLNGLILPVPTAIQNWDQLMKSDFQLGLEDEAYFHNDYQKDDPKSLQVRQKLAGSEQIFYPIDEGLEKVRIGRFALLNVALDSYIKLHSLFSDSEICSLSEINKLETTPMSFMSQKNTPYKEHFKRIFQLLTENGCFKAKYKLWVPSKPKCQSKIKKNVINIRSLSVAFVVFLFGILTSVIMCLNELLIYKKCNRFLKI